jgi:predicted RNA-binding protein with PUA-like domain
VAGKWLFKSDPAAYSFGDLLRDGTTVWDEVSNNLALKHLRAVRKGDEIMIYHSGKERAIVGLAKAASQPYPDPKRKGAHFVVVDIAAGSKLSKPVTLSEIRKCAALSNFCLVRLPRLSVMPVSESHWQSILAISAS